MRTEPRPSPSTSFAMPQPRAAGVAMSISLARETLGIGRKRASSYGRATTERGVLPLQNGKHG